MDKQRGQAIGIPTQKEPLTMTIPEFAVATKCSRGLAYSLARRNELPIPVIFLGPRRMCVSRAAVRELLAERKSTKKDS